MHDSVINAENQVPSEIRKNDINLQAQLKPLPIFGLASDLTTTLRNHWVKWVDSRFKDEERCKMWYAQFSIAALGLELAPAVFVRLDAGSDCARCGAMANRSALF